MTKLSEHNAHSKKLLDEMLQREEIDQSCYNFLYNDHPRTPRFYMLPQIHKGKLPPPGRPIVSANRQSYRIKISTFVDYFLKPCIPKLKSYVKDTKHFPKNQKDGKTTQR